jgi:Ni/Co efflux regulator RcnB
MKKLLIGTVALSLLVAGAASAAPYRGNDNNRGGNNYQQGQGYGQRNGPARRTHWRQGQRLPQTYYSRGQYVDYRSHRLRAPPRGYRWVRADNDYALVAISTGLIAAIIAANN